MPRVTLRDVARRAGVDLSTASRAIGKSTRQILSPNTVARVMEAAAELGYRPNTLARGLRSNRTATIGMLVPDLTNPLFWPIVRGIEDELARSDYTLILANTDNDETRERAVTDSLLARQIDGIILATSRLDHGGLELIDGESLPVVLVVNRMEGHDRLPSVVTDEQRGVGEVIAHLVDLGHERIAHVAGPQSLSPGKARYMNYRRELKRHRIAFDRRLVTFAEAFAIDAGAKACRSLLDGGAEFTAIFAANDLIAIGCLDTVRDEGLRVPDDVSLVGYNDMLLVDKLDPALTTVRIPQYEMGVTAAQLLLERVEGADPGGTQLMVTPELVRRASTGPPRA